MNDIAPRNIAGHSMLCPYKPKDKSKSKDAEPGIGDARKFCASNSSHSNFERGLRSFLKRLTC
jgi:hypothetical protein